MEADTGANISVVQAEMMQDLDWVELEQTNVHIQGYSGIAEPCLGHAKVNLRFGTRYHEEDVFFSNTTTANFLSRDACKAFGIIPKGFPHVQLNSVKMDGNGSGGQNPMHKTGLAGQNPMPINAVAGQYPMKESQSKPDYGQDNQEILKMVEEFANVFDKDKLPAMATEPMVIKLKITIFRKQLMFQEKFPMQEGMMRSRK